jgi:hypothetical protein
MIHVGHSFRTVDLLVAEAVAHEDHVDYRLLAGNSAGQVSMWANRGLLLGLAADIGDLLSMVPERGHGPSAMHRATADEAARAAPALLTMEMDADEIQVQFLPEEGQFLLEAWDRDQPAEAPSAISLSPTRTDLAQLRGSILAACASRAGECCTCGQTLGPVAMPQVAGGPPGPGHGGPRGNRHDRRGR